MKVDLSKKPLLQHLPKLTSLQSQKGPLKDPLQLHMVVLAELVLEVMLEQGVLLPEHLRVYRKQPQAD